MKLAQTLEQFNADHVTFCDPVHNTVIQSGLFSRFLYSSPHFSLSGIFLLVPLQQLRFSDRQYRGRNVQPPHPVVVGSENECRSGEGHHHSFSDSSTAAPAPSSGSSTQGKHRYSFSPALNQQVVAQIVQLEAALLQKYLGVTHWDPKTSSSKRGGRDIQGGCGDGRGSKRAVTTLSDQLTHGCIRMTPMSLEHGCGGSGVCGGVQTAHSLFSSSSASASWTAHREKKEEKERTVAATTVSSENLLGVFQHVVLKLTGIWETATEYGVTFKFLSF